MPPKAPPSDLPIRSFPSAQAFEAFLEREHATSSGIHLKLARKSSGIESVSPQEALDIALCFGWINGQGNGFDENWYLARYTPRRPKSMWSKVNVEIVARLQEAGRIRPAGLAAVDAAKADGRWDRAYAGPATIEVPVDLANALKAEPAAASFFEKLNRSDWYTILWRIETASPKSRANRIDTLVQQLAKGQTVRVSTKSPKAPKALKTDAVGTAIKNTSRKRAAEENTGTDGSEKRSRRSGLRSSSRLTS